MRNLNLDEFTKYKFLSGVELSPDGKNLCFVVHSCNVDENKYDSNLWLYNTESKRHFQLTGLNKERSFFWSKDSEHIIFSTTRSEGDKKRQENGEELSQYYRININGGEASKYFEIPLQVTSIKEVDEESFVLTAQYNPMNKDLTKLSEKEKAEELKRRKEEKEFEVLEEIPFWANGGSFTSKQRNRLYLYNKTSGEYETVSPESINIEGYNLNEGKSKLIYTGESFQNGVLSLKNAIYVYDIATGSTKQVLPADKYSVGYVNFINDDKAILWELKAKNLDLTKTGKFTV